MSIRMIMCHAALLLMLPFTLSGEEPFTFEDIPRKVSNLINKVRPLLVEEPAKALDVIEDYSGDEHALVAMVHGQALNQLQRHDEAANYFVKAYTLEPRYLDAGRSAIQALAVSERWQELLAIAASCIDSEKETNIAWLRLPVRAALEVEDYELASAWYQPARRRFPSDESILRLGLVLAISNGDVSMAKQRMKPLLATNSDDSELWLHAAHLAMRSNDETEARIALEAAVLANPDDSEARMQLAIAQYQAGLAANAFGHAVLLMNDTSSAALPLDRQLVCVRIAADAAEYTQAAAWLENIPKAEWVSSTYAVAVQIALDAGDGAQAREYVDQLIVLDPTDLRALIWASRLASDNNDVASAEVYLRRAYANKPEQDDHRMYDTVAMHLAHVLVQQERREEAITLLQQHVHDHPDARDVQQFYAAIQTKH